MSEKKLPQSHIDQLPNQDSAEALSDMASNAVVGQMGGLVTSQEVSIERPEVGLLTADEYRARRSDTLLNDPEVELDEQQEVRSYFDRQEPTYVEQIKQLAALDNPMNSRCRLVITIPAYNEGSRIGQSLEQYAKQDIDPSTFEVVVFATPVENDTTPAEIARFREEHPELSVVFASKPWNEDEPATVGNGRKYAADIAMARILARGPHKEDTVLMTNDADTLAVDENYLSSILAELDSNQLEDALVTPLGIPAEAMAKPNVAAAFSLLNTFEETYATGNIGADKERIPEPALTNGRSTAVRTSVYAAVGGYNPGAVISEDWELGWMIADARDWKAERVGYFEETQLITDPRRFIDTVINRVPTDQQLLGFKQKPGLRQLNNQEILKMVPDTFDWELFQDDVDSIWRSQESGANMRIPKDRFEAVFSATMKKLGVEYTLDEYGGIVLTNVDRMLTSLAGQNSAIEIVHSQPRTYTPELVKEIRDYFSGVPVGVLKSRRIKAERIANEIRQAQENGELDRLPDLQKEYGRFAV